MISRSGKCPWRTVPGMARSGSAGRWVYPPEDQFRSRSRGASPTGFGFPVVFRHAPNVMPDDPHVRLLDLNGDGITDIL
jgi:hypothetical protein